MAYIEGVTRGLPSRLNALLLVVLILGGGGSLPLLDAVSHGVGVPYTAAHVESASAAESHRDFCSLGASVPLSAHLLGLDFGLSLRLVEFPQIAFHSAAPRSADLRLLPQPRAPPGRPA